MKSLLLVAAVLTVGTVAFVGFTDGPNDEGVFHPDHSRVFNSFQDATSERVGEVSSVAPDSECKQIEANKWRCYRRWAPVGRPGAALILEADLNVYDERVVVGAISRVPD